MASCASPEENAMIVVFGSLNMDLVFRLAALPQPGETRLCANYESAVGGKGANQAAAAARAGAECRMVGCIGADAFGARVVAELGGSGVEIGGVLRVDRPTGCAAVMVDDRGENQIAVASGANQEARSSRVEDAWLRAGDTLLLQLEVPAQENWLLLRRACDRGLRTVLNAAPAQPIPAEAARLIDILVVNEHEARTLLGADSAAGDDSANAGSLAGCTGGTCIVTLGDAGAVAAFPGGRLEIGALPVDAVDSTGAGDAFVGVLAAALDEGHELAPALRLASIAGALACTVPGALPGLPHREAILAARNRLAPARTI
jgi:ribokinase